MSERRDKQNEAVKNFIEVEVIPQLEKHTKFEKKVDNYTKRFEAIRSVQGLSYGDDPVAYPKLEPWEDCSDIGIPIEAITLRAIIARFIKTILSTKPICNVGGRGGEDTEKAKTIEEYQTYSLEEEMNFERNFYDVLMDVGLAGGGFAKLIEADEEYEWEETYFTLLNPLTQQPVLNDKKNESDDEWPEGYPVEVPETYEVQPDPITGITPILKEITIDKKDKTYFGTKIIPINPKDVIVPDGADTWDIQELPWVGHRFRKNWYWLKEREGNPDDGGYENVDKVKPYGPDTDGKPVTINKKIQLIEIWGKVNLETKEGKEKPREIIALYAIEKKELLGWIPNPYKGKRMLFHWQIMPMSHRFRGKSIPEFALGIRNLVDSIFNNMVNKDTINSHPPFVYDEASGFDPEVHEFGPNEFWGVTDQSKLGRLNMGNTSEFNSQWILEFTMGILQKLFGVTDYTLGSESNIASNKTARGIMAIIGEGNFSFDTMISLLQMTNKRFFTANIEMHAKMMKESGMEKKVFFVTESQDENPFREIEASALSLKWNFIPRGTSLEANAYRKKEDAMARYKILATNPLFSPQGSPATMKNFRILTQGLVDAYEMKNAKLPTAEELAKEAVQMKASMEMEVQKRQKMEQLKQVAKHKKDTPEGKAAKKVLADMEMGEQATREAAVKDVQKSQKR